MPLLILLVDIKQTAISDMEPWLSLSFGLNLAYPILVSFGQFSGKLLKTWVEREMLRVIPPLCENEKFNKAEFAASLDELEKTYLRWITRTNVFIITWSLLAALSIFVLLLAMGLRAELSFPPSLLAIVFLGGAVPIGLTAGAAIYVLANRRMAGLSAEHNGVLKYNEKAPKETVERATRELQDKLRERRQNGDPI